MHEVVRPARPSHAIIAQLILSSQTMYAWGVEAIACKGSVHAPTWYGDLLKFRRGGAMLVNDSDSDRVGPWTKGYLRTTTDGSGQVGNREGLLSCLTSAER